MTSFAIALHGQCCRRHVVGQRIVMRLFSEIGGATLEGTGSKH